MTTKEFSGIQKRTASINIEDINPIIVNGETICLNCGKPIPKTNRKYCSQQCSLEFFAKHNQAGLRNYVYKRENGKCQKCGYTYPHFRAAPSYPLFSKPRPEEFSFPNYTKTKHRIGKFENILVIADKDVKCSCGKTILVGEDCYCKFPKKSDCHMYCLLDENIRSWYKEYRDKHSIICQPTFHCVDCGLKAITEIEKLWDKDHRKALIAFKKAYTEWSTEYDAWIKTGIMQRYDEENKKYHAEYEVWRKQADFRDFIADHVIPIAIGGPEFDLGNIQLLCSKCNKEKTKRDMAAIAHVRKRAKLVGGYGQSLDAHFQQ